MKQQGDAYEWPFPGGDHDFCKRSRPVFSETTNRFENPWPGFKLPNVVTILKWRLKYRRPPREATHPPESHLLPLHKPAFMKNDETFPAEDCFTWLGHATCLFEIGEPKVAILTDPIFADYCSPLPRFLQFGDHFRRLQRPPCQVTDLPSNYSRVFVLISHSHYDHLDYESIAQLVEKYKERLTFCVPARQGDWFRKHFAINQKLIKEDQIVELTWWQTARFADTNSQCSIEFVALPSQHWSERIPFWDTNYALWASWAVVIHKQDSDSKTQTKKLYFSGDTGYCEAFSEIGRQLGPFDACALPIGAFHPREFLSPQHVDPQQAVQMHLDLRSKRSFAIHHATYPLGDEAYSSPRLELQETLLDRKMDFASFLATCPGESVVI